MSLSSDDVLRIKRTITHDAVYAERVSLGFALNLANLDKECGEAHAVLREIDALEDIRPPLTTKPAEQFRRSPLKPLWHKHFYTGRHLHKNIGIRWNIDGGDNGNKDLDAKLSKVAVEYEDEPDLWQKKAAYDVVIGGLQARSEANRLTGDWIVFAKHEGQNYYLDLAAHEEGTKEPERLMDRLRAHSAWEFPFVFDK